MSCVEALGEDCGSLHDLIENGGYAISGNDGGIVAGCNVDRVFTPASVLKVPTALAALHLLGPEYRFRTLFYRDRDHNLYIKGYGDPMLISEEVALIVQTLSDKGVKRINGIFIDDSSFEGLGPAAGAGTSNNPYDVPVGGAAVNFNTVAIRVDERGNVESSEEQTPTLPIMRELGAGMPPGCYRLNICQGAGEPRKIMARHTAELFRALQEKAGIAGEGPMGLAAVPQGAVLVHEHRNSRELAGVILSFLKYSNNFTANLVFLACAAKRGGYPVSWEQGRAAVGETLSELLGKEIGGEIYMVEGSGLSRENKVTARAIIKVLELFADRADLLAEVNGVRVKSGTLRGVFSFAGYLEGGEPFVILLNQKNNTRDQLLSRLRRLPLPTRAVDSVGGKP